MGCREQQGHSGATAAIVLAAGRSTRMGRNKLLLPVEGKPMVLRVIDAALASHVAEVVVVIGHEAESVKEAIKDRPVKVVFNADYERGMSTSLQAGLQVVAPGCEAAIFMLGDQPFVDPAVVDLLLARFIDTKAWIVRPAVGDSPTHPVLMSAELFLEIMSEAGDVGGREICRRHAERQCLVLIKDPLLTVDIDTDEDYRAAAAARQEGHHDSRELRGTRSHQD